MSYILDALKRADAERERGQVPGLHAHPLGEAGGAPRPGAAPRWALWAGVAVGAMVLAALAWRMGADANAPLPAPLQTPAEPLPGNVATATPPAALPTAAQATPPAPALVVPSYAPPPARVAKDAVAPPSPGVGTSAPATAPAAPTTPATTAAAPPRIPLMADLPPSLRKELPALAVGGSVYSDDAASRFIMLNGEVAKEGSQPAPGLVVERIEPRSAVLRFKGERFRLPF
ncbi:general secretion pathway protein GspB [Ideonella sp.]|uniref:general secretion pathway protein GspB n=1 Tax=Ideonella sp. TaxID=1929293 RepID=UPI002B47B159|nr:general secretion pathway protein GspB [Ideonella sp.]HJV70641.1 general secretion pathway protein GspB [Ideonella sp.]